MAIVTAQAPVAFSATTTVTGASAQLFQVSSSGVTAGLTAGNFYLDSPPSNLMNGRRFIVSAGGWILAHGATQTIAVGLQIFPWNTSVSAAKTASGTATFTVVASGALTAGTYYDFQITQQFYGEAHANTLSCFLPTVYMSSAAAAVNVTTVPSPVTVSFASASQTEPITGINTTYNYPLASFAVSLTNSVADTVETAQLTQFSLEVV